MVRERSLTLIDLELEALREREKYYGDPLAYLEKIRDVARNRDADARAFVFGSFVEGSMRPDSDIDVLIVTRLAEDVDARMRLRMEIAREIGECTPFEIHMATREEYENWYRKFIDDHNEV